MEELGINVEAVRTWFSQQPNAAYVFVQAKPEHVNTWKTELAQAVRRCYITDEVLDKRTSELEKQLPGLPQSRQVRIIESKLPGPGSTMAGDFGEILIYFYQCATAHPKVAFGPKKWRLKQDRTKPAPGSDVIHFVLPEWPQASDRDELLCAEVKLKSGDGKFSPIADAIAGCAKDRTSRLAKTLLWLKARAIGEPLGATTLAHLDRFIKATDYPPARKRFSAVAVICTSLMEAELKNAPVVAPAECTLVIVEVPDLKTVYTSVFGAAKQSVLAAPRPA